MYEHSDYLLSVFSVGRNLPARATEYEQPAAHAVFLQRKRSDPNMGGEALLLSEDGPDACLRDDRSSLARQQRYRPLERGPHPPPAIQSPVVDTLTSIKVFRQVVESGSFVAAGERLDISTAMVSKHVMHVEQRLGLRLLNRNSRTLSLTEPGRVYFERCKTILDDLEETELELGSLGSAPRGTLRVSCPSWAPGQRIAEHMAEYRRRYPEVVVDVSFDDRVVDLVEEGYDLALRVTSPDSLPAGVIARPVRPVTFYIAASHEYLKRHGAPKSPAELAQHDFVAVGSLNSVQLNGPQGKIDVPVRVVLRYRSAVGVANAVASGIGLAPLPALVFEDPVFRTRLTPVLTDFPLSQSTLYVVYVSRKYLPLKIRTFRDLVIERISQTPEPRPLSLTSPE
jgi:DNA-binding transcriptional LysR family regulator